MYIAEYEGYIAAVGMDLEPFNYWAFAYATDASNEGKNVTFRLKAFRTEADAADFVRTGTTSSPYGFTWWVTDTEEYDQYFTNDEPLDKQCLTYASNFPFWDEFHTPFTLTGADIYQVPFTPPEE